MSAKMNYEMYPTDYVNKLMQNGKREKAVRFMEYWHDMRHGIKNSLSFYKNSWSVSHGTAFNWVKEFKREAELFWTFWWLKNQAQYNYVKKTVDKKLTDELTTKTLDKAHNIGVSKNAIDHPIDQQLTEEFNIYDDDGDADADAQKEFQDIFFIYSMNGGYTGRKEEAFREFKKIRMEVELDDLVEAITSYLHDKSVEKKFNITNFLKNKIYLGYIKQKIKIYTNGAWYIGKYDKEAQVLTLQDGTQGVLKQDIFSKKLLKEEIIILGREVA